MMTLPNLDHLTFPCLNHQGESSPHLPIIKLTTAPLHQVSNAVLHSIRRSSTWRTVRYQSSTTWRECWGWTLWRTLESQEIRSRETSLTLSWRQRQKNKSQCTSLSMTISRNLWIRYVDKDQWFYIINNKIPYNNNYINWTRVIDELKGKSIDEGRKEGRVGVSTWNS